MAEHLFRVRVAGKEVSVRRVFWQNKNQNNSQRTGSCCDREITSLLLMTQDYAYGLENKLNKPSKQFSHYVYKTKNIYINE